jgi:hypothetical protein
MYSILRIQSRKGLNIYLKNSTYLVTRSERVAIIKSPLSLHIPLLRKSCDLSLGEYRSARPLPFVSSTCSVVDSIYAYSQGEFIQNRAEA